VSAAQVVSHAVFALLHSYPPGQVDVTALGQTPFAQLAAAVSVAPAQLWPRHDVVGYVQAVGLAVVHAPPHAVDDPVHCERTVPWGGPDATWVHFPTLPVTSHAWHWPLQAPSQHTPSTHSLLVHSLEAAHVSPFPFVARQGPPLQ